MSDAIRRVVEFGLADYEIGRAGSKAGRTVTAYATFFGQPAEIRDQHGHYWEEINRAAFNRTISHGIQRVGVFYNHGRDLTGRPNMLGAVPLATPLEIRADGTRGLLTVSRYNESELADAVLEAWRDGQITGQSFSGPVYQSREVGQRGGVKHLERMELGLREYGPTFSPAYEGEGLVAIRSRDELAELVRSMITQMVGTPAADAPIIASTSGTSPEPGVSDAEDPDAMTRAHSRNRARRNALVARRLALGVHRDGQAQERR
jgi:HK97 family phage prohead protease